MFNALWRYRYNKLLKNSDSYIEVLHTTDKTVRYREFVDGVFPEGEAFRQEYLVGSYAIKYTDGTEQIEDIFYGQHIINKDIVWYDKGESDSEKVDANPGAKKLRIDQTLSSVAGVTMPIYIDGKIYCKYLIEKKYPEKQIESINFVLPENATWEVEVKSAE